MTCVSLFTFVIVMLLSTVPLRASEIIAHRGASHDAPENTQAAFKLGWEQQADANELDMHLTKDGHLLVIHDGNTKRTAGLDAAVAQRTLAELRTLDAGRWKGERWQGEKLPTLGEVLATIPAGKRLFVEIKCGPESLPKLAADLKAAGTKPEQIAIISFNLAVVEQAKRQFPRVPVLWIVGYKADKKTEKYPDLNAIIAKAKAAKLDGLDLDAKFPLDKAAVAQVKAAGLQLYVWTVDDAALAARLSAAGVDGITTNRPGWLREQLK